jgi:hypothetical protein
VAGSDDGLGRGGQLTQEGIHPLVIHCLQIVHDEQSALPSQRLGHQLGLFLRVGAGDVLAL